MFTHNISTHKSWVKEIHKLSAFVLIFLLLITPLAPLFAQEVTSDSVIDTIDVISKEVSVIDSDKIDISDTNPIDTQFPIKKDASIDSDGVVSPIDLTPEINIPIPLDEVIPEEEIEIPEPESLTPSPLFNPENLTAGLTQKNYKSLEVDQSSGALIYSYPITIPPGRNGLQPDIKLEYNNQQVQNHPNLVGYGWNIDIPYIERLNKTGTDKLYTDDYFVSSLTGELIYDSGINYVSKVDNGEFTRYEYDNDVWTAYDKKGTKYTFGLDTDSRQDDGGTKIFKWMLQEIRDTNDNYIKYTYFKDSGQIYPEEIIYTGNGTTDGIFRVVFVLESIIRPDVITSYASTFLVTTNYRVEKIQTWVDNTMNREYVLGYTAGDNGSRSLLDSIIETGYDISSNPNSLNPISFDYSESSPGWTLDNTTYDSPVQFANGYQSMLDINGDAFPDVIESWYDNSSTFGIEAHLNDTNNSWNSFSGLTPPILYRERETRGNAFSQVWDQGTRVGDLNGDLFPDIIKGEYDDPIPPNVGGIDAYVNTTGTSWTQDSNWNPSVTFNGDDNIHSWGSHLIDINGDGLLDIIRGQGSVFETQINIGTGFDSVTTAWNPPVELAGPFTQFADVNNDGLPDIINMMVINNGTAWLRDVYLNVGDGTWINDNSFVPPIDIITPSNLDAGVRFFDVNGDGLVDQVPDYFLVAIGRHTQLNTGVGWVQSSGWDVSSMNPCDFMYDPVSIVDVNVDGMIDFFCTINSTVMVTNAWINNTQTTPDLLTGISFPQGGSSTVVYKKSSQYRDTSNNLLNPHLPILIDTVESVTTTDPIPNPDLIETTTYSYENGEYFYNSPTDRKFTGFGIVEKTDGLGNVIKTYYHQGNDQHIASEEPLDAPEKIGKSYKIEKYDNNDNLFTVQTNKWESTAIGTTDADFVFLSNSATLEYDGNSTHKDTAVEYIYDSLNGNVIEKIERGKVDAVTDGSYTDLGADDRTTAYTYAYDSGSDVIGNVSVEEITNSSSVIIKKTRYYYDNLVLDDISLGNMTRQEDLISGTTYRNTEYDYDGTYGMVIESSDPNGNNTDYTYDSYWLYPATVTNAIFQPVSYTYDYSSGKVIEKTDLNNFNWTTVYDGLDRQIEEKIPDGSTGQYTKTQYIYDDINFPNSVAKIDWLRPSVSRDTITYFDGLGRPIQERSKAEASNEYTVKDTMYDENGRVLHQSLPYFNSGVAYTSPIYSLSTDELYTTYTYDPLDRITNVNNEVGNTSYIYDDWATVITDPQNTTKVLIKDAYNNLIQVDEHEGSNTFTTEYDWNRMGKLLSITDALGNERNFTYDKLGRRLTAEDLHAPADTIFGTWTHTYDDGDNLVSSIDPNGQVIDYTYDGLNRLTSEDNNNGAFPDIEYIYDNSATCVNGMGHLCDVVMQNNVNTLYDYDALGNISNEEKTINSTAYTTSYEYDYQSNPTKITYPDNSEVKYSYNDAGLIELVEEKKNGSSFLNIVDDFDYSPMGQVIFTDYSNGTTTTNTYNATELYHLTEKITLDSSSNKLQDLTYTYDTLNNITDIVDTSNTNSAKIAHYTYDDLSRLTEANITNTANQQDYNHTYTYNPIGNITDFDGTTYLYEGDQGTLYANPHAVTGLGSNHVDYDRNGNMTADGTRTNTWNYKNELTQTITPTKTITYKYDHEGNRVKYSDGTITTINPNKLYSDDGTTETKNIYARDTLIATIEDSTSPTYHYIHPDHLSGSSLITDSSGTKEQLLDYYPYGDIRLNEQATSFDERRKYTGHQYDADSDLLYMGARYYQGKRGQFLSEDPSFLDIGTQQNLTTILMSPQSLNSYSYALNNPLRNIDPDGKSAIDYVGGAISSIGAGIVDMAAGAVNTVFHPIDTVRAIGSSISSIPQAIQNAPQTAQSVLGQFKNASDSDRGGMLGSGALFIGSLAMPEARLGTLSDSTLVCRGGLCGASDFLKGTGVKIGSEGKLSGVSVLVGVNGENKAQLLSKLPSRFNGEGSFTTLGAIRNTESSLIKTGSSPLHFEMGNISAENLSKLFSSSDKK